MDKQCRLCGEMVEGAIAGEDIVIPDADPPDVFLCNDCIFRIKAAVERPVIEEDD